MMIEALHPSTVLVWDYLWQSTLFLGLGLGASLALRRRPARAHRFLLLAMLAALVTPALAQAARRGGWGLLAEPADSPSTGPIAAPAPVVTTDRSSAGRQPSPPLARHPSAPSEPAESVIVTDPREIDSPSNAARLAESPGDPYSPSWIRWRTLAMGLWLMLVGLAVVRLVVGFVIGQAVARRAGFSPTKGSRLPRKRLRPAWASAVLPSCGPRLACNVLRFGAGGGGR